MGSPYFGKLPFISRIARYSELEVDCAEPWYNMSVDNTVHAFPALCLLPQGLRRCRFERLVEGFFVGVSSVQHFTAQTDAYKDPAFAHVAESQDDPGS